MGHGKENVRMGQGMEMIARPDLPRCRHYINSIQTCDKKVIERLVTRVTKGCGI